MEDISDHLTCRTGTLFSPPDPLISVVSAAEFRGLRGIQNSTINKIMKVKLVVAILGY